MRTIILHARIALGMWMLFWGLNWFFRFVPQPIGLGAADLEIQMMASGLFSVAKAVETVLGIALLINRFVPLMLVLAAPVTFNVAWVHFAMQWPGTPPGYFVVACHASLLVAYARSYLPMLRARARPFSNVADIRSLPSTLRAAIGIRDAI